MKIEVIKEKRNILKRSWNAIIDIINGIKCGYPFCCVKWYAYLTLRHEVQWIYTSSNYMNKEELEIFSEIGYVPCVRCIKRRYFVEIKHNDTKVLECYWH